MRHRILLALPVVVAGAAGIACASLDPRVTTHVSQGAPREARGIGRVPIDTGLGSPGPRGTGADQGAAFPVDNEEVRRVCRASGWPRGWIASAYVEAPGECPVREGADAAYNAAVIVRYEGRPRASVLDVCAGQVVPVDWVQSGTPDVASAARCPGAGKDGVAASIRMRKVR